MAMHFDTAGIAPKHIYQLLVGGVTPRPIAWVSTISANGISNLAPHSFFTVASCAPPVLAFTHVNPQDGHEKDTLRNLRATRQCVINVVDAAHAEVMNASCGDYPHEVSEFEAVGIPSVASRSVVVPGVETAPVRFECGLREIQCISPLPLGGHLILLDVLHIVVDDRVWHDGLIDQQLLDAVGKLGGDRYARTRDQFEMKRPKLDKPR